MGTSSSFRGKKGDVLLPGDLDIEEDILDNEDNNDNDEKVSWTDAKTSMSKYVSSGGNIGSPRRVVRNYIKAAGGRNKIMSSLGKDTILRLNGIVQSLQEKGLYKTLEEIGISLNENSLSEAFSKLTNYIHKASVTKDDVAIRTATANTMDKLMRLDFDEGKLDKYSSEVLMQYFFAELIWQRMLIDYGFSFEKYGDNINELVRLENKVKEYIKACVEKSFKEFKGNIFSKDIFDIVFKRSLEIMEE